MLRRMVGCMAPGLAPGCGVLSPVVASPQLAAPEKAHYASCCAWRRLTSTIPKCPTITTALDA